MADVKKLSRKDRAARTRRAIVGAATEEFRRSGYHGATMAAIAQRAGVAVQTVYFVFHAKPALLRAAIDTAVMGADDPVPPDETPWWQECTATASGRKAIELFTSNVAEITARAAALDRVALAAATTDPELGEVISHHEALRAEAFGTYVDTLAARGLLKDGMSPEEAADVLLTLTGSEVFLGFTEARGWPVDRYVAWLADTLSGLLLRPSDG